jgi:DNA adenine methylase
MINTPFNYTGNKYKILSQILPLFDYNKDYFIDLFCGGGSVYTNVASKYKKVMINDVISDLVLIHKNLIQNPDEFIEKVKEVIVKSKDDLDYYLELRKTTIKIKALKNFGHLCFHAQII